MITEENGVTGSASLAWARTEWYAVILDMDLKSHHSLRTSDAYLHRWKYGFKTPYIRWIYIYIYIYIYTKKNFRSRPWRKDEDERDDETQDDGGSDEEVNNEGTSTAQRQREGYIRIRLVAAQVFDVVASDGDVRQVPLGVLYVVRCDIRWRVYLRWSDVYLQASSM